MATKTVFQAKLIKPKGSAEDVSPKNGKSFTLDEVYELLEVQMVEVVRLKDGLILICDEEGLFKSNPVINTEATRMYQESAKTQSVGIVGNAILCSSKQFK